MSRQSLIGDIAKMAGNSSIVDSINKLEKTLRTVGSYIYEDNIVPSGDINGSNKVFVLPYNPNPNSSLRLYLNGVLQAPAGVDFTLSSITVTFINAPLTGSTLRGFFRRK